MERVKTLFCSKAFIYILIGLFSLLLACLSDSYDYDLYARLIVGENFFKTGWITYKDFLSYTPTHTWYDHEWGASVIFYAFFKMFGSFGLILVQAITLFVTTFFVIKTQRLQEHAYPITYLFLAIFMILFAHQNPNIVRCHMFSFMFFSMLLYLLEKIRLHQSKALWVMPLVFLLWNNIHGGVVAGLGIVFVYMLAAIFSKKPWFTYFGVLAVSTPLLVINPYGLDYLNFLFSANTMHRKFINEWWAVFAYKHILYYFPVFCFVMFGFLLKMYDFLNKRFDFIKISVLTVTVYLGIVHIKLLSLPIIVVSALFYNDLMCLFNKDVVKFLNKISVVLILISVLYIPLTRPFVTRLSFYKYPILEVEFIKQNNIKGNILTNFGLGSYIAYKLYPNNLIYMDGRYEEVYNNKEFENLYHYEVVDEQWQNAIKDYPTEILMPNKEVEVYKKLQNDSDWEEVYTGPVCGIFLPKHRDRYKPPFKLPSKDIKYYEEHDFDNLGYFGKSRE